jgi:hypothetical protein
MVSWSRELGPPTSPRTEVVKPCLAVSPVSEEEPGGSPLAFSIGSGYVVAVAWAARAAWPLPSGGPRASTSPADLLWMFSKADLEGAGPTGTCQECPPPYPCALLGSSAETGILNAPNLCSSSLQVIRTSTTSATTYARTVWTKTAACQAGGAGHGATVNRRHRRRCWTGPVCTVNSFR